MNDKDKREIAKLLGHDPAYADQAKADYLRYTAKGLPLPKRDIDIPRDKPLGPPHKC